MGQDYNLDWESISLVLASVLLLVLVMLTVSHVRTRYRYSYAGVPRTPFDEILKIRSQILKDLAHNAPLIQVLERIIKKIELGQTGLLGSFFIVDRSDLDLFPPNDSHDYVRCLIVHYETQLASNLCNDCLKSIGVEMFSPDKTHVAMPPCATAVLEKRPVVMTDQDTDSCGTEEFIAWAKPLGITACWAEPIIGTNGVILGAFTLYYRQGRKLHPEDQELINLACHLSTISIEHKRTENRQFLLQSFVDHASEPVAFMFPDEGFRVHYANQSAIHHFGYSLEQLQAMSVPDFDLNYSYGMLQALWKRLQQEGSIVIETVHNTATEQNVPVEMSLYPLHHAGHDYITATFRNIRERKQTEQALIAAKQSAEEAGRIKYQLLANTSHELRTPLNAILGLTELMRDDMEIAGLPTAVSAPIYEYLDKIRMPSLNLIAIVNDLLDFSRMEAGKLVIRKSRFDVRDVIKDVLVVSAIKSEMKALPIHHTLDCDIPGNLVGDPLRLGQILTNLLENAIKFTQQGEIVLDIRLCSLNRWIAEVSFSVRDTGIGISADDQSRLFKPFSQVDGSTSRRYGGTGLGLVICANLVRLMGGGTIQVSSTLGTGSVFSFTLPFERRVDEPGHPPSASVPQVAVVAPHESTQPVSDSLSQRFSGVRVLLVEDTRINQLVATKLLERQGMVVTLAENGQEAVDRLVIGEENFDLVLMDIQMPVMNGYMATLVIRQQLRLNLPIIAVTANTSPEDQEKALSVGMNAHISKPIDSHKLLEILTHFITPDGVVMRPVLEPVAASEPGSFPAVDTASRSVPRIDWESALENMDGDHELYISLIVLFTEEHAQDATLFRQFMAAAAYTDAHRIVHTLKGITASLGLSSLTEISVVFDGLFKSGQFDRINERVEAFEQELALTLAELEKISL